MVHKIGLAQACDGLIRYKTATGKSPHTIADYRNSFKKLLLFFEEDPPFGSVHADRSLNSSPGYRKSISASQMVSPLEERGRSQQNRCATSTPISPRSGPGRWTRSMQKKTLSA